MKLNLKITDKALNDIDDIGLYTSLVWGDRQKLKYRGLFEKAFARLRQKSTLGKIHADLPGKSRIFPVGRHYIVYYFDADNLYIIRILHEKMDMLRHID